MAERENEIIERLITGVRDMDEALTVEAAEDALREKVEPLRAINEGLVVGMHEAGRLYEQEEYFVPELLLCSDALYAGMDILAPHLTPDPSRTKTTVVMGVVAGDTHDIGKNLVKLMLEVSGFAVCDLGRDVPLAAFVDKVVELEAGLLCMSTLMSTTMDGMGTVIRELERKGVRKAVKVLVGGGPLSQAFAERIGADGYASNATGAVKLARRLTLGEAAAA